MWIFPSLPPGVSVVQIVEDATADCGFAELLNMKSFPAAEPENGILDAAILESLFLSHSSLTQERSWRRQ
jgi:hypothetical protein